MKYLLSLLLLASCTHNLSQVNAEINAYNYIPDPSGDYWKTSAEFYLDGGGDCEDFTIAKYARLKLWHEVVIVVGFLKKTNEAHAVLLVDGKHVLDNRRTDIYPLSELKQQMTIHYYTNDKGEIL